MALWNANPRGNTRKIEKYPSVSNYRFISRSRNLSKKPVKGNLGHAKWPLEFAISRDRVELRNRLLSCPRRYVCKVESTRVWMLTCTPLTMILCGPTTCSIWKWRMLFIKLFVWVYSSPPNFPPSKKKINIHYLWRASTKKDHIRFWKITKILANTGTRKVSKPIWQSRSK